MPIFAKIYCMKSSEAYQPEQLEAKWYKYWMEHNYFHSEVDERKPYTIVIPPPNVTGELHMGHMLNNTIQDVLIRRARLQGYNACWVPGTDHASIATEAKVVEKLKHEGIDKSTISRQAFMQHAWEWKETYGNKILEQLKKLGASCDWDRVKFTMDQDLSESVLKVFIDLHEKGLIYKGTRMVNWDPKAQTTLSDEEIDYTERSGQLYYIKYPIVGENAFMQIATTRPETIFGDTALCVNPDDERLQSFIGKKAIVPIVNREVEIIADEQVNPQFGTGCLKITPAHAETDYVIGKKHDIEFIDCLNDDGTLNHYGQKYEGKDRFVVRKEFSKALEEAGFLLKKENYINKVGLSERTKVPVEPKLSNQWFVSMKPLVEPAIKAVLQDDSIKLFPEKFKNTYRHWLENIKDWNISRQLWWGHRIPVYYYDKNSYVVAMTEDEALEKAREKSGNHDMQLDDLQQDEDVLDTWFSSWLWPMSVFDGIRYPDNKEIAYYYPTKDLVTGPDILFFWVARMIIAGYEYRDERPFENVYLTGLVRDAQRRKMSKSLGNSPNALALIKNFGADGVRVGLLLSSAAGNDLLFEESLCQQGKNFANKIWNATKLIKGLIVDDQLEQPDYAENALNWFDQQFNATLAQIEDHYSKYRISDALMSIYKLIWDDFCSWVLESIKSTDQKIDKTTYDRLTGQLEKCLLILHPFMPFVTEDIWHQLQNRTKEEALIISQYPEHGEFDGQILQSFNVAREIIKGVRHLRKEKNIGFKKQLKLYYLTGNNKHPNQLNALIEKLAATTVPKAVDEFPGNILSFRVDSIEYAVEAEGLIDVEAEKQKLNEELRYYQGFLKGVEKKLSNDKFVQNAPDKVVDMEKKKKQDTLDKIKTIEESLSRLEV
jgi:valyl-tRNA synthetase